MNDLPIIIAKHVQEALKKHKPVVALESTIISHGLPYPQNVAMVQNVENIIVEQGAIPATIAIMDGYIRVGLDETQRLQLAQADNVIKVSTRDIASVVVKKHLGATTVAATMKIAAMVGIDVFATGGIGGVHIGANQTFDISRDLEELAQTPVIVVCAGAKSILDLDKTMEYLETQGVEVIGYKTDVLPAFYTRNSHINLAISSKNLDEVARIMKTKRSLNIDSGIVLANPIPKKDALDETYMQTIINEALEAAKAKQIKGKAITPYLLKYIVKQTKGKALEANLALVYHNAKVAALLAKAYQDIKLR